MAGADGDMAELFASERSELMTEIVGGVQKAAEGMRKLNASMDQLLGVGRELHGAAHAWDALLPHVPAGTEDGGVDGADGGQPSAEDESVAAVE